VTKKPFGLLELFSVQRPVWTADQIALALNISLSSAYRLIGQVAEAGLIDALSPGHYVLGPAIIQMDRQIQLTDPLLRAARPVMDELINLAPEGSAILLCRAFKDAVLCVHQVVRGPQAPVSYERGRPRPLFRGATSKSILAFTRPRILKRLYADHAPEISAAGLGTNWKEFLAKLRVYRKAGFVLAKGEVDPGRVGISAPVLDGDRNCIGSLSYVLDADRADDKIINRLAPIIIGAAREVERAMSDIG
jgi:DNA-binding IclR family transcriptional regulator